jgi:anaerobic nitric oxide reductase transcription regulator
MVENTLAMNSFSKSLISIVADLSQDLSGEVRYKRLLDAIQQIFPCDAAALLQLEGSVLKPLAIAGLSGDTMGRRFVVSEHPRLAALLDSHEPVRFLADSELPDPYDGLIETHDGQLDVHDCMGVSLYIDEKPWGVLSMDAMCPGTFDDIDLIEFQTFIGLTEATVKAAQRIEALEARVVRERLVIQSQLEDDRKTEIVGNSTPIKQMKDEIDIVAQSYLTVLILGETGVGKELVARRIHNLSTRSHQPMIYVNCAALPENIAESELFGHVKGAFSGAVANRSGKFELADNGSLFLDEIGELSPAIQAKLLRVLQSGEIQRVGSDSHIEVDVRIIAATNRDLQQEVGKGHFRSDLYHRLSVYPLQVPPLRERGNDVLLLAGFLLEANHQRLGVGGLRLAGDAKRVLQDYQWPGNVRELEHLLSRAALKAMADQGREVRSIMIEARHLGITEQDIVGMELPASNAETSNDLAIGVRSREVLSLKTAVDQFQRELITDRLREHTGNLAAAARDLEVNRSNLFRLVKRLGVE